jgi:hypothetical protein
MTTRSASAGRPLSSILVLWVGFGEWLPAGSSKLGRRLDEADLGIVSPIFHHISGQHGMLAIFHIFQYRRRTSLPLSSPCIALHELDTFKHSLMIDRADDREEIKQATDLMRSGILNFITGQI